MSRTLQSPVSPISMTSIDSSRQDELHYSKLHCKEFLGVKILFLT